MLSFILALLHFISPSVSSIVADEIATAKLLIPGWWNLLISWYQALFMEILSPGPHFIRLCWALSFVIPAAEGAVEFETEKASSSSSTGDFVYSAF